MFLPDLRIWLGLGHCRKKKEERKTTCTACCRDGRLLILLDVTMPSNIWLFDINNCSPTSSTTDLSHHGGAITVAGTFVDASISMDGTTDGRPGNDSHSSSTLSTPSWPTLPASLKSQRTRNPIRVIVDPIVASAGKTNRDDGKDLISLAVSADCIAHVYPHSSYYAHWPNIYFLLPRYMICTHLPQLGDPTAHSNFPRCQAAANAIRSALDSPSMAAGYANACGTSEARQSIASYHSYPESNLVVDPDDVIVASGCSGALELAITALLDDNSVLLVPRPGFPIYQVIAESHGASVAFYDLDPNSNWECNLEHIEQVINRIERQQKKSKR